MIEIVNPWANSSPKIQAKIQELQSLSWMIERERTRQEALVAEITRYVAMIAEGKANADAVNHSTGEP